MEIIHINQLLAEMPPFALVCLHLFISAKRMENMGKRPHTITIIIYNRDAVYKQVSDLLHDYAEHILLRIGHPIKEKNIAIIFLIVEMTNDELGAFSGKLGQLKNVKVKATTIKLKD